MTKSGIQPCASVSLEMKYDTGNKKMMM